MTTQVLVIDDHPLIAETLGLALRAVGLTVSRCPDIAPPGIMHAVATTAPRLVVLDLDLGEGRRGEDLVSQLIRAGADVLVLTGSQDRSAIGAALAAGALGWVSKASPFPDLVAAAVRAARGEAVTPASERETLIAAWRQADTERRALRELLDRLSPREREVLERLASGHRAEALAREFVVSMATVRSQIRAILLKLEVGSQLEAVAVAHRAGLGERVAS